MAFKTASADERKQVTQSRGQKSIGYIREIYPIYVPKDGDNSIRIVPPLKDDPVASIYGVEVWAHFYNKRSFLAPGTFQDNVHNPILDRYIQLKEEGNPEKDKYKASCRNVFFLLDMHDLNAGVKVWSAPSSLLNQFLELTRDRQTGGLIPIEDPEQGRIIHFTKTGKGMLTKYVGIQLENKPYPLNPALAGTLRHFSEILVVPTVEEAESYFYDTHANVENNDTPFIGADEQNHSHGNQQPAYVPPANQPHANQQPAYVPPANQPHANQQPAYVPPAYVPPAYVPPANQPHANQQPAYVPPANQSQQPANQQPAYVPPANQSQQPANQPHGGYAGGGVASEEELKKKIEARLNQGS